MAAHWPSPEQYRKQLLRLVAFLGRYDHQPAWWCWRQPTADLDELANEVGELVKEENAVHEDND